MPLAGRPMVEWSIAALRACERVGPIVVACPPGHRAEGLGEGVEVVGGGATRSASVAGALAAVGTELVAIHDAARPLLTPELAGDVVATLLADPGADGAIAATPVADTVKRASSPTSSQQVKDFGPHGDQNRDQNPSPVVEATVDRDRLWAAQTPQVFRVEALRRALGETDPERSAAATDEAMLVEAAGGRVLIHPSPPENIKVTTPFDLRLAEALLSAR